jgi:hypothetical protein
MRCKKTQKRVVTLRDSPCGDTSNAATVAVMTCDVLLLMEIKIIFFQICSEPPRVIKARMVVFDVSPRGLLRNVK